MQKMITIVIICFTLIILKLNSNEFKKMLLKKCRDNDFAICSIDVSKGWIGIEPEEYSYGLYFYVLRGSCKFGVPFKDGYDILKKEIFIVQK